MRRFTTWCLFAGMMAMLALATPLEAKSASTIQLSGTINLNEAGVDQLRLLPGIGPSKAVRIIEFRRARRFARIEDIVQVKGIGPATFRKLAAFLRVSGPSTLRRT